MPLSDFAVLGRDMHALATELFPINRSITGPGFRATLDRLEAIAGPMEMAITLETGESDRAANMVAFAAAALDLLKRATA